MVDAVRVLRGDGRQELGARRGEERAVGVAAEVLVDAGRERLDRGVRVGREAGVAAGVGGVHVGEQLDVAEVRADQALLAAELRAQHVGEQPAGGVAGAAVDAIVARHHAPSSRLDVGFPRPEIDVVQRRDRDVGRSAVHVAEPVDRVVLGLARDGRVVIRQIGVGAIGIAAVQAVRRSHPELRHEEGVAAEVLLRPAKARIGRHLQLR